MKRFYIDRDNIRLSSSQVCYFYRTQAECDFNKNELYCLPISWDTKSLWVQWHYQEKPKLKLMDFYFHLNFKELYEIEKGK